MAIEKYDPSLYPFESKWINIENNLIHYIDEGKGEVLFFCHPPVSSSFMYPNMIPSLSKEFRCVALDFPGFGLSKATDDFVASIPSLANIIEQFLTILKLHSVFFIMQEVGGHAGISV